MATPLTRLASLKVKLGALVGISVLAAAVVATVGASHGVEPWLVVPVAVALALILTQLLSAGMIAPLREMTDAARRMARGDYSTRVETSGNDEVATLAKAFTTMAADLKDVDQHRRDLVANVSHELRTPASALRAVLENMADGVTPANEQNLRSVLAQSERLSDLLTDLLALSRIDAGLAPLRKESIVVADLLRTAVDDLALSGRTMPVDLVVDPPDLRVRAEAGRLRQAVTNLLDNAARHSPPGAPIRVRARLATPHTARTGAGAAGAEAATAAAQGNQDAHTWLLDVEDDGPGIRAEDRERIFERFGTASAGGTGLGLAITRWVAEIHGGRVDAVEPGPGRTGARLRLTLPLDPPDRHRPPAVAPQTSSSAPVLNRSTASPSAPLEPPTRMTPAATPGTPVHASTPGATMPTAPAGPTPPMPAPFQPGVRIPVPANHTPAPPVIDSIFGTMWPERDPAGRPRLLLAALAVGLLAAIILPFRTQGLGTTLVLLAAGATLAAAARRRSVDTAICGVLGVGLALIPMLRAADWLIPLSLLAGAVVVVIGITPARSLTSLIGSALAWPLAGLRGLPWLSRMLGRSRRTRTWLPIVRTAVISVLALVVFGALFASADALVAHWVDAIVPDLSVDTAILRGFVFAACFGIMLAGVYLATNPIADEALTLPPGRPAKHAWEWMVPAGLVAAAYLVFIAAQLTAWLAGHDYVERTTGLTYADYVHQGFGQLTFATVLTLLLAGVVARHAPRENASDRLRLRVVLGLLGVLTLVVVGSALWRMNLYQQAYGFTTLRLMVDAFEIWVGLIVVMVLVAGISLRGKWIPRAAALTGVALILGLGLMNPDAWVANRNIDRYERLGASALDVNYLASLSPDATATIVDRLTGAERTCSLPTGPGGIEEPDDALEWNLGRSRARSAVADNPIGVSTCAQFDTSLR